MVVTDGGNVTEDNEGQYSKAPTPMVVIDGGSVTVVRDVQWENKFSPIVVIDDGSNKEAANGSY